MQILGISELDRTLLVYGYATALIEIGQPEVAEPPISPTLHNAPVFAEICIYGKCTMKFSKVSYVSMLFMFKGIDGGSAAV